MIGDEWYESEESTRTGMVAELQRIRRRTLVRPIPVILLALLITGALYYRLSTRKQVYEAEVVLALTEESLSTHNRHSLPVEDLREYVLEVLLPKAALAELIERRNLHPLRKKLGIEYGIEELWTQVDVAIWKNSFVDYRQGEEKALRSARIGIKVSDVDPDLAFDIARDLATIIIKTADVERQKVAGNIATEVKGIREGLDLRQEELTKLIATKLAALATARKLGQLGLVGMYEIDITNLYRDQKRTTERLRDVISARDSIADRIAAAGLEMTIEVVEEQRADRTQQRAFVLILVLVVVGVGSLFGSALLLGAFDSRVHDTDDVERLGLPVLGHVPGFPGDHVGSLEARGVARSRVPS